MKLLIYVVLLIRNVDDKQSTDLLAKMRVNIDKLLKYLQNK